MQSETLSFEYCSQQKLVWPILSDVVKNICSTGTVKNALVEQIFVQSKLKSTNICLANTIRNSFFSRVLQDLEQRISPSHGVGNELHHITHDSSSFHTVYKRRLWVIYKLKSCLFRLTPSGAHVSFASLGVKISWGIVSSSKKQIDTGVYIEKLYVFG